MDHSGQGRRYRYITDPPQEGNFFDPPYGTEVFFFLSTPYTDFFSLHLGPTTKVFFPKGPPITEVIFSQV